jgi:multidrug resistance efflux pump
MPSSSEDALAQVARAESAVTQADENVKQAQVELLAARQGSNQADIDQAEVNVKQAEVELMAAKRKLEDAQAMPPTVQGS